MLSEYFKLQFPETVYALKGKGKIPHSRKHVAGTIYYDDYMPATVGAIARNLDDADYLYRYAMWIFPKIIDQNLKKLLTESDSVHDKINQLQQMESKLQAQIYERSSP